MKKKDTEVDMPQATPAELQLIDGLPLAYIEMDAWGTITRANRATLELHPQEHGDLIGKIAWDMMATDEKEPACAAYLSHMETGEEPRPVRRSLYTREGEFRSYDMYRSLIHDEEGRPAGMRILSVDVTEAKRELEEARRARALLESAMESFADGVVVIDALGFIHTANPAAERLFGWKCGELAGKVIEQALPLVNWVSCDQRELTFTMALEGHCRGIATFLSRDGREVRVELTTSPILGKETGYIEGVVSTLRRVEDAAR